MFKKHVDFCCKPSAGLGNRSCNLYKISEAVLLLGLDQNRLEVVLLKDGKQILVQCPHFLHEQMDVVLDAIDDVGLGTVLTQLLEQRFAAVPAGALNAVNLAQISLNRTHR